MEPIFKVVHLGFLAIYATARNGEGEDSDIFYLEGLKLWVKGFCVNHFFACSLRINKYNENVESALKMSGQKSESK